MSVQVKIPTTMQPFAKGLKWVDCDGDCLEELLRDLENRCPGFLSRLVGKDGKLVRFVNIYINDDNVRFSGLLASPLADGDVVTILPAVAGGA